MYQPIVEAKAFYVEERYVSANSRGQRSLLCRRKICISQQSRPKKPSMQKKDMYQPIVEAKEAFYVEERYVSANSRDQRSLLCRRKICISQQSRPKKPSMQKKDMYQPIVEAKEAFYVEERYVSANSRGQRSLLCRRKICISQQSRPKKPSMQKKDMYQPIVEAKEAFYVEERYVSANSRGQRSLLCRRKIRISQQSRPKKPSMQKKDMYQPIVEAKEAFYVEERYVSANSRGQRSLLCRRKICISQQSRPKKPSMQKKDMYQPIVEAKEAFYVEERYVSANSRGQRSLLCRRKICISQQSRGQRSLLCRRKICISQQSRPKKPSMQKKDMYQAIVEAKEAFYVEERYVSANSRGQRSLLCRRKICISQQSRPKKPSMQKKDMYQPIVEAKEAFYVEERYVSAKEAQSRKICIKVETKAFYVEERYVSANSRDQRSLLCRRKICISQQSRPKKPSMQKKDMYQPIVEAKEAFYVEERYVSANSRGQRSLLCRRKICISQQSRPKKPSMQKKDMYQPIVEAKEAFYVEERYVSANSRGQRSLLCRRKICISQQSRPKKPSMQKKDMYQPIVEAKEAFYVKERYVSANSRDQRSLLCRRNICISQQSRPKKPSMQKKDMYQQIVEAKEAFYVEERYVSEQSRPKKPSMQKKDMYQPIVEAKEAFYVEERYVSSNSRGQRSLLCRRKICISQQSRPKKPSMQKKDMYQPIVEAKEAFYVEERYVSANSRGQRSLLCRRKICISQQSRPKKPSMQKKDMYQPIVEAKEAFYVEERYVSANSRGQRSLLCRRKICISQQSRPKKPSMQKKDMYQPIVEAKEAFYVEERYVSANSRGQRSLLCRRKICISQQSRPKKPSMQKKDMYQPIVEAKEAFYVEERYVSANSRDQRSLLCRRKICISQQSRPKKPSMQKKDMYQPIVEAKEAFYVERKIVEAKEAFYVEEIYVSAANSRGQRSLLCRRKICISQQSRPKKPSMQKKDMYQPIVEAKEAFYVEERYVSANSRDQRSLLCRRKICISQQSRPKKPSMQKKDMYQPIVEAKEAFYVEERYVSANSRGQRSLLCRRKICISQQSRPKKPSMQKKDMYPNSRGQRSLLCRRKICISQQSRPKKPSMQKKDMYQPIVEAKEAFYVEERYVSANSRDQRSLLCRRNICISQQSRPKKPSMQKKDMYQPIVEAKEAFYVEERYVSANSRGQRSLLCRRKICISQQSRPKKPSMQKKDMYQPIVEAKEAFYVEERYVSANSRGQRSLLCKRKICISQQSRPKKPSMQKKDMYQPIVEAKEAFYVEERYVSANSRGQRSLLCRRKICISQQSRPKKPSMQKKDMYQPIVEAKEAFYVEERYVSANSRGQRSLLCRRKICISQQSRPKKPSMQKKDMYQPIVEAKEAFYVYVSANSRGQRSLLCRRKICISQQSRPKKPSMQKKDMYQPIVEAKEAFYVEERYVSANSRGQRSLLCRRKIRISQQSRPKKPSMQKKDMYQPIVEAKEAFYVEERYVSANSRGQRSLLCRRKICISQQSRPKKPSMQKKDMYQPIRDQRSLLCRRKICISQQSRPKKPSMQKKDMYQPIVEAKEAFYVEERYVSANSRGQRSLLCRRKICISQQSRPKKPSMQKKDMYQPIVEAKEAFYVEERYVSANSRGQRSLLCRRKICISQQSRPKKPSMQKKDMYQPIVEAKEAFYVEERYVSVSANSRGQRSLLCRRKICISQQSRPKKPSMQKKDMYQPIVEAKEAFYVKERYVSANSRDQRSLLCRRKICISQQSRPKKPSMQKKDMYQPIVETKEAFYVEERYVSANSRGQRSLLCRRKICISQQSRPKKPSMQKKDMYQPIVEAKEAFYVEERYVSANSRGQRSLLCRRKICISQQSRPKKPSMQKKDMYQPIVEAKEAFYVEERYVSANSRGQRSLLCRRKICISQQSRPKKPSMQKKDMYQPIVEAKEAFYVEERYVSANSRGQRSLLCRRKICISQQSRPKKPSMQKKDMYQPIVEAKEAFYVEERYVSANSRGQRSLCRRKIRISQQSRPKKPSMQKKDMYQPIVEAKEAFYVEERYVSANSRGQRSLLCRRKICISQQSRPKKPSMQKKDMYQPIVETKEAFYVEERYVSANSRGQRSLLCRRKICISQQSRPKKPSMQKKDMYQPIVEAKEAFYVEERYVSANSRGQRSLLCRRKICISQQSRPKKPSMQKKDMYQPIVEAKEAFYVEERYVSANSRGQRSLLCRRKICILCRRKICISQQSRPKKPSMQKKDMYQPIVETKEAFYVEERYVSANSRGQRSLLCRRQICISQQSRPKKPSMQKKDMYQPIVEAKEAFYVEERYVSANSRGQRSLLCRRKICIISQQQKRYVSKEAFYVEERYVSANSRGQRSLLCRRKICISQRPKKPSMQKKYMYQPIVEAKEAFYVEERYVSANSRGQRSLLCRRKICISQQSRPKKPSMQKKDMYQPIVEAKEAFYVEERYVSANSRGQRSLLCSRKICISQQSRPKKPSMQKKDMYQPIVETKEAFYVEERYVSANSRGQRSLLCRRKICISQQSRPKKPSMQKKDTYQPIVEAKEAFYVEERYVSANSRGQRSLLCRRKICISQQSRPKKPSMQKKDMYQPIVEAKEAFYVEERYVSANSREERYVSANSRDKEAFYVEERYVSANSRGQRSLLCRRKICISQQSRPKKPSMQKKDMYQPIVEAKEAFYVEERYVSVSANSRGQRSLLCRRKICISQQSRPKKPSMQKKDMYQPIVEAKEAFYVEERYVSANSRGQRSLLCMSANSRGQRSLLYTSMYQPIVEAKKPSMQKKDMYQPIVEAKEAFYVEERYVSANSRGQRSLLCRRKICISQQSRPKKPSMQKKDMYQPIVEAKEAFYVEERYVSAEAKEAFYVEERYVSANSRGQRSLLCRRNMIANSRAISQQSRPKKPSMQKKDMYQPIVEAKEAFYVKERYVSANSRDQRSLLCRRKICISQQSRPKKPSMQKKDMYQPIVEAKEAFYVEERYVSANSRGQRSLLCRRKICISQQSRPKKPSMQKKDMYQPIVEAKEAFYVEERYVSANSRGQRSLLCRRKICISQQSRPKKPSMQKKDMYQPIVEAKEAFYVEERYVSANSRGQRSLLCRRKICISQQSRPKKPSMQKKESVDMQKKDMYQPIVEAKEAFYVEERYVSANSRGQRSLLCRRKICISQQSRPKKPSMQKKDMYQPIVEAKEAFYVEERYVSANSRGQRSLLCRRKICISQQSRPKKPSMQKKDMYQPIVEAKEAFYVEERYVSANSRGQRSLLCRRKICISQQSRPKKPSMQKKDMYQPIVETKEAFYVEERYVSANSRGQRSLLCRRKICISQQSRPKKPSMQKKDMYQPIVEAKEAFYVEERYVSESRGQRSLLCRRKISANSRGQRSLLCKRKICISQQSRPKKPSMQKKDMYQPIVEAKEAFYVEERYVSANSRGQRSLLCRRKICISQQSRPKKPSMQKKDMYQPIVEAKEAFYVEERYVSANSRGQRSLLCRRKICISQQSRPKKPSMQKKDMYQPIVEAKEAFYVEERYVSANSRGQRSLLCRRKICISQQSRPKKPSMQKKDMYQPIVEAKEAFYVEERYVSANSRGQRSLLCKRRYVSANSRDQRSLLCRRNICISQQSRPKKPSMQKKDMYQPIVEAKEAFYVEERYVSANSRGQRSLLCRRKICISQQSRPKKPSMQKKDMYQPIVEAKEAFYVEERYVSANSRGQRSLLCRRKICISQQSRPKKPSMQKKDMYQPIVEAKEAFYVEERYVSANSRDQRSLLCRRKICISQQSRKPSMQKKDMQPIVPKKPFYVEERYVSANSRGQRSLLCRRKICISQQSRPKKPSMQKKDMYQPIVEAKEAFYVEERYVSANSRGQRSLLCRRKICISQQSRPKKPSMQKKDMYQPIVEAKEAFYVEERYVSANSRGQRSLLCRRKICISQQSRPKKPSMQKKDMYQPIVEAKEAFYVEERYVSANSRGQRSLLCRRKICISQQSRPKKPSMQKKDMYQPIVETKEAFYVVKKPSMQKKDMYQPIVEAKEAFYVEERYVSANSRGQRSLLCRRKICISQQSRPKKPSMQKKDMYQPIVEAKEAFYVEERYVSANSRGQRSLLCRKRYVSANSRGQRSLLCRRKICISQQSRPKKPSMQKKDMYQPIVEAKEAFYVKERYVSANSRDQRSLLCRRKICISQQSRPKKPSMQKKDMYQPIVEAKEAFYVEERYVSANSRGQRSLLCRRKICISQQSRPKKPSMQKKDMYQPIVEAKEAFYVEERYVSANSRDQRSLLCRRKICISQQSRPKKPSMQKKDMYQPIVEAKEAFYVEERYVSANSRGQRSLLCRRKICISQQSRPKKPSMQKKDMYQPIVEAKEAFYVEERYVSANSRGQRSLLCRRKICISQQSRPKKPSMQKKDMYQPIVEAKEAFYVEERYVSANSRGQRSLLCRRKICISQQSRPKKPSMQKKDMYQPIVEAKEAFYVEERYVSANSRGQRSLLCRRKICISQQSRPKKPSMQKDNQPIVEAKEAFYVEERYVSANSRANSRGQRSLLCRRKICISQQSRPKKPSMQKKDMYQPIVEAKEAFYVEERYVSANSRGQRSLLCRRICISQQSRPKKPSMQKKYMYQPIVEAKEAFYVEERYVSANSRGQRSLLCRRKICISQQSRPKKPSMQKKDMYQPIVEAKEAFYVEERYVSANSRDQRSLLCRRKICISQQSRPKKPSMQKKDMYQPIVEAKRKISLLCRRKICISQQSRPKKPSMQKKDMYQPIVEAKEAFYVEERYVSANSRGQRSLLCRRKICISQQSRPKKPSMQKKDMYQPIVEAKEAFYVEERYVSANSRGQRSLLCRRKICISQQSRPKKPSMQKKDMYQPIVEAKEAFYVEERYVSANSRGQRSLLCRRKICISQQSRPKKPSMQKKDMYQPIVEAKEAFYVEERYVSANSRGQRSLLCRRKICISQQSRPKKPSMQKKDMYQPIVEAKEAFYVEERYVSANIEAKEAFYVEKRYVSANSRGQRSLLCRRKICISQQSRPKKPSM